LDVIWPPNLSVRKLCIWRENVSLPFPHLASSISCPVKIVCLKHVAASHLYPLVEKLGPHIKELAIKDKSVQHFEDEDEFDDENFDHLMETSEPLDLSKVLAACPQIEMIQIDSDRPFAQSTISLQPEHFANCKEYVFILIFFILLSLFFQSKSVVAGSLEVFRVYLPQFGDLQQKFRTKISKITGISGTFWKRHLTDLSGFYWSKRLNKKPLNLSFCSQQLCNLHLRGRSKFKVTFCDTRIFQLKFEFERTILGTF